VVAVAAVRFPVPQLGPICLIFPRPFT
jgi:hypothetical protein